MCPKCGSDAAMCLFPGSSDGGFNKCMDCGTAFKTGSASEKTGAPRRKRRNLLKDYMEGKL